MYEDPVLAELQASGLALDRFPGNSAKIRLALDLASTLEPNGVTRVLDVGCAGADTLNLWEAFLPIASRLELVGVDIAYLERARARAEELGLEIELVRGSATQLPFGDASFDAVVCTQVLEHLRDWRAAVRELARVVRTSGRVYVTCDSIAAEKPLRERLRIAARRVAARAGISPTAWERGIDAAELRAAAETAGLGVELLAPYGIRGAKVVQRYGAPEVRQLWLAFEEALLRTSATAPDPAYYTLLYLRGRR